MTLPRRRDAQTWVVGRQTRDASGKRPCYEVGAASKHIVPGKRGISALEISGSRWMLRSGYSSGQAVCHHSRKYGFGVSTDSSLHLFGSPMAREMMMCGPWPAVVVSSWPSSVAGAVAVKTWLLDDQVDRLGGPLEARPGRMCLFRKDSNLRDRD